MPRPGPHDVLLVVDVQNDFCPAGALAVPEGEAVVEPINRLGHVFDHVLLTQDWHPANHLSFASQHPGHQPFDSIDLDYGSQVLWPDHCVQGTSGAALHEDLALPKAELIIRKGYRRAVDSYSAFCEADGRTPTGLAGYLRERELTQIFLVGLATDFCVQFSALDARRFGFGAVVIEDCCRAIDLGGSLGRAWEAMAAGGVERCTSDEILLS